MSLPPSRPRVGIDIRPLSGASGRRGVGTYIRGLVPALRGSRSDDPSDPPIELVLFGHGAEEGELPADAEGMARVRLRRPRKGITIWDQAAWFPTLVARRLDVLHSTFYAVPLLRPRRCRVVQTIHDVTPIRFPGAVSPHNLRIFRANFRLARTADRIIVPSNATRRDVVERLGIPSDRVVVIPEACDIRSEETDASATAPQAMRSRLSLGDRRYILHTGGHDRIKNLGRLVEAFGLLSDRFTDLYLVISGEHGPETAALMVEAAGRGVVDRVRFPGWVPRADLIALYRGAAAVVYPSLAEGFGLPVLEAMTCGAPVVASDAGALPEVGGDACLLVDPHDAASIAEAVARILEDGALARALSRRGRARAAGYSWDRAARATRAIYREVAS